jgi:uracil-DNA glycosylase family 4
LDGVFRKVKKPESCKGCPFYQDGNGFVPDELRETAVMIYGQNPGREEEEQAKPFVGKTGALMEKDFFPIAGLTRDTVSLGNAIRCRVGQSNEVPPIDHTATRDALAHCHTAHFKLPEKTKLIVSQGEYALYALTQEGAAKFHKVSDWRGYVLPFEPVTRPRTFHADIYVPKLDSAVSVFASYHLAYLFRDPTAGLITKWDWRKIPQILRRKWPRPLAPIQDGPPAVWPKRSAFDTEFNPSTKKFLCYSLAYPSAKGDGSLVLRVSEKLEPGALVEPKPLVVMQNAPADLPFLEKMLPAFEYDDIMHQHAVLWSDFAHDLGFLGSLYSTLNRWKHLSEINPKVYSAGDAYATWEIFEALEKEFDRDPDSRRVYKEIQLRLIPIICAAEAHGVKVNPVTTQQAYDKRQAVLDELALRAQALTGWPLNLRSNDHVRKQLYEIEGLLKLIGLYNRSNFGGY